MNENLEPLAAAPGDVRYLFYLGQSWFDAREYGKALEVYGRRVAAGGWAEEVFYARYRMAQCLELLGRPYAEVRAAYETCYREHPYRAEPLVRAALKARGEERFAEAYVLAKRASRVPKPEPGALFVEAADYEYRALDEQAIAAYYCEFPEETFDLCTELLDRRELPTGERTRVEQNRDHAVPYLQEAFLQYDVERVARLLERPLSATPRITLAVTSCRRLDLFVGTVCSFLAACTDIERVDRFICVDDNSSAEDRAQMQQLFPFFEFIFKEAADRGHARSLNLIREMVRTPWLVHLEDDWHFFAQRDYIGQALEILEEDAGLGQVLFNRNYAETLEDRQIPGGYRRRSAGHGYRYVEHEHHATDSEAYRRFHDQQRAPSNVWWPHYSLRPGVVRTAVLERLGPFDEQAAHFELDYAQRYLAAGFRSAFLDGIYCIHAGRLTSERHDPNQANAYQLNALPQFGQIAAPDPHSGQQMPDGNQAPCFPECPHPSVSILLVVWNKLDLTRQCLRSILEHSAAVDYEVIVVDNGSSDGTGEFLSRCDGLIVDSSSENLGYTIAANRAASRARGDYLVFLNNDVVVGAGWLEALLAAAEDSDRVGAVGAKLVFPDGRLQEAGSIIWQDGSTSGYGRGDDPRAPEYNYRRDVDYCSGACLLVRRRLFAGLGQFDEAYAPAYYEDTDLCMGIRQLGYRVVYQPAAEVVHHEFGSGSAAASAQRCAANRPIFVRKWSAALAKQWPNAPENLLRARDCRTGPRLLLVDDMLPVPRMGSGYPRAARLMGDMVALGYVCTILPTVDAHDHQPETAALQQQGVEVLHGTLRSIDEFSRARAGFYDVVVVSRPQNAQRTLAPLRRHNPGARLVYDAEAITSRRDAQLQAMRGQRLSADDRQALLAAELSLMTGADAVVTVSEGERRMVERAGHAQTYVWGHPIDIRPPVTPFAERRDLLFVGGFLNPGCPNEDAVFHFVTEIFPLILARLPVRLIIVGTNRLDSIGALACESIVVVGSVNDLQPYFESARLFIVPTRLAAGLPWKLFEAMSHGLPAVVTPIIGELMELPEEEHGYFIGSTPGDFARKVAYLYNNEFLWQEFQRRELKFIADECSPALLRDKLGVLLRQPAADTCPSAASASKVLAPPAPNSLMLRLDLTNKCTLGCLQCTLAQRRRVIGESAGEMDFGMIERIAAEVLPYASSVALSCEAEPTLHSRFLDVLSLLARHPGRVYKITTNANTLSLDAATAMIEAGIGEIYVSVDGASQATYERIRRGGRLARVDDVMRHFKRLKDERGLTSHQAPLLQINYTLMRSTLDELNAVVELCRQWGVHRLVLQHIYLTAETGLDDESLLHEQQRSDRALARARALCATHGIDTLFPEPFASEGCRSAASEQGPQECLAPWRMVRIRWTGEVFPCDLWPMPGFGTLAERSFLDIWNDEPYARLRRELAARRPTHANCVACTATTTENVEERPRRSPISYLRGER